MAEQSNLDQTPEQKSIIFVTTADTDLLTADRALAGISYPEFPRIQTFNPSKLDSPEAQAELLEAVAKAGAVVLRLLGGKRAMPDAFDRLVQLCHSLGVPLVACPGHQEWDEDLISACSVSVAEVDTVFAYLMRGGVANFRNLFVFLSDTYCGSNYGAEAPAPAHVHPGSVQTTSPPASRPT